MIWFLGFCMLVFGFLAFCWKTEELLNVIIKLILIAGSIWSFVLFLIEQGYIIKQ